MPMKVKETKVLLTRYRFPKNADNEVKNIWFALSRHGNSPYKEKFMQRITCEEQAHVWCTKGELRYECPQIQSRP
jgi:hypothetical protein